MDFQLTREQQEMVTENLGLVRYIVNNLRISSKDFEDMVSIGTMGLMKAAATFDSSENNKFSTYAGKCIKNEVLMELRKKRRDSISLDEVICQDNAGNELTIMDTLADSKSSNIEDRLDNAEVITKALNYVLNCSTLRKTAILLFSMAGLTQEDIANMYGISRSYVQRIIKALRDKLKNNYQETNNEGVFNLTLKEDRFEIIFSTSDVGRFNEIFANFLVNINNLKYSHCFKVSCTRKRVVIYLPAEPESFEFIACIIREIENFSMSFDGTSQISSENDEKEEASVKEKSYRSDNEGDVGVSTANAETASITNTASSTSSISSQIREYILSKDSFFISELKEKFPVNYSIIRNVIQIAKNRGVISSDARGHYIVKK